MPKKILEGIIINDTLDKTVSILVERTIMHHKYKKVIKKSAKYHAHDPDNKYKKGERIRIEESKPFSKLKKWIVIKSIEAKIK